MPFNINDINSINEFKQQALSQGVPEPEIAQYINSKRREYDMNEIRSTSPMSDKLGEYGLPGKVAGAVLKPGESALRFLMGAGSGLGLAGMATKDVLQGNQNSEALKAIQQKTVPFWTPEQNQIMGDTSGSLESSAKIAKQGIKAGAGLSTYGVPIQGGLVQKGIGGFAVGALSKGSEQEATVGDIIKSGAISSLSVMALSALGDVLSKLKHPKVGATAAGNAVDEISKALPDEQAGSLAGTVPMTPADKIAKLQQAGFEIPYDAAARKIIEDAPDEVINMMVKNPNLATPGLLPKAGDLTDDISTSLKGITDKAGKASEEALKSAPTLDTRVFSKNFTVPTKLAGKNRLDVMGTSKQMMDYGIGKNGDLNSMKAASEAVTGDDGIVSNVVRDALSRSNAPISTDDVVVAAQDAAGKYASLDDKISEKAINIIKKSLVSNNANTPQGAYKAMQELEKLGYAEASKSTYLTARPGAEDLGDVYLAAADALKKNLSKAVFDKGSIEVYKQPGVLEALSKISPKLAEKFQKATTLGELRSLQAPFVKLSQILDQTEMASFSQASKVSQSLAGGIVSPTIDVIKEAGVQQGSRRVAGFVSNLLTKLQGLGGKIGGGIDKVATATQPITQKIGSAGEAMLNPAVARGVGMTAPTVASSVMGDTPGQVLAAETGPDAGENMAAGTELAPESELGNMSPDEQGEVAGGLEGAGITPQFLMMAALADPKNASVYLAVAKMMGSAEGKAPSAKQQFYMKNAKSGLAALKYMEDATSGFNTTLLTKDVPIIGDNTYKASEKRLKDVLRNISGTSSDQGFQFGPLKIGGGPSYDEYMPKLDDSAEDRAAKFAMLRNLLMDFADQQPANDEISDLENSDVQF